MKQLLKHIFLPLIPVFFFLTTVQGQQSISGVITDQQSKEILPGATLEIKGQGLGVSTNAAGYYEFNNLPVGEYKVVVHLLGYELLESTMHVDHTAHEKKNFTLHESSVKLTEVEVKGHKSTESDRSARLREKRSSALINVVSAEAIRKSPDLNVADISQRVSGITLDKGSDSKDEFLIIRGLGARYNNTLINGISIPSPDDKSRSIPLDIIPADLVANLVVSKTLTPDMEGDAIGGTVDVQLKDAPSQDLLEVNVAAGFNQQLLNNSFYTFNQKLVNRNDPSSRFGYSYHAGSSDFPADILKFKTQKLIPNTLGGLTFGKRFLKNKLGLIISASSQGIYSKTTTNVNNYLINKYNIPQALDELNGSSSFFTTHTGVNTKLDYIFNANNKISLLGIYLRTTDQQSRFSTDTLLQGAGRNGPGTGRVDSVVMARYLIQNLVSFSLKGNNRLTDKLDFDWTGNYGRSNAAFPDNATMPLYNTLPSSNGYIFSPFSTTHSWQKNSDKNLQAYLNFNWRTGIGTHKVDIKFGGLFRHRDRVNYNNSYSFNAIDNQGVSAAYFTPNFNAATFTVDNPQGQPQHNPANYSANEDIASAYLMGKFYLGKLKAIIGLRDENTLQSNHNVNANSPFNEIYHYFRYNDILPTLNLQYALTQTQDLRFSYNKSISRPAYFELVQTDIQTSSGIEKGNPSLKHSRADNLDFRYDFFPNADDAFMLGAFYKRIFDPIERGVTATALETTYTPLNGATATNFGLEANFVKYFGDFGFSGNYTFTQSNETRRKIYYQIIYNPDGSYQGISNTNPLEKGQLAGQSRHVANLSLLFRSEAAKINASFNILFQGRRIDGIQDYLYLNEYQLNYTVLSFAIDKQIGKRLTVFAKCNNLNNSPFELRTQNGYFVRKDRFGQDYLFGLRFRIL